MDEEDEEVFDGGGIHVTPQQYEYPINEINYISFQESDVLILQRSQLNSPPMDAFNYKRTYLLRYSGTIKL